MSSFIQRLYTTDKVQWIWEFFPEYAELFGGYPTSIPCLKGAATGISPCPERTPWYGWSSGPDVIMANGLRLVKVAPIDPTKRAPNIPWRYEAVPEEEYRLWCDQVSWYRNGNRTPLGGPGLDPRLVAEGVDDRRSTAYWVRNARYERENLPVKPDFITCPDGVYLPMRGPSTKNPWGVNSAFILNGARTPIYISDRYGPDKYDTPPYVPIPMDADGNQVIPTQEEYDEVRWSQWL